MVALAEVSNCCVVHKPNSHFVFLLWSAGQFSRKTTAVYLPFRPKRKSSKSAINGIDKWKRQWLHATYFLIISCVICIPKSFPIPELHKAAIFNIMIPWFRITSFEPHRHPWRGFQNYIFLRLLESRPMNRLHLVNDSESDGQNGYSGRSA